MLWLRGIVFTVPVPLAVAVFIPRSLHPGVPRSGGWQAGWLLVLLGVAIYGLCLLRFLSAGGTPAIFFTRALRHLIGEEPKRLVSQGLYRVSRNPMYVAVVLAIFGQAIVFASVYWAVYGLFIFLFFHLVVVLVEEPHLRAPRGSKYEAYCRRVPRWLSFQRHRDGRP